jgi:hypothetical protein
LAVQVTAVCDLPGCCALATDGPRCPVHRRAIHDFSVICGKCKGTGLYFYSGQELTMACQTCGGVGVIDKRRQAPRLPKKDREPIDQRGLIQAAQPRSRP